MSIASQPIGIFDSGIGGLTVARSIRNLMPEERFIYFGDTAHMPYGDKSQELIQSYALRITDFLLNEKECKAIVIACNTASAAAYEVLRDQHKGSIPVINVIDPMVEHVIADDSIKHLGIIATKTTVSSGVYQEKLARRKPSLRFSVMATPLLAPMIEEGFFNDDVSEAVITKYLSREDLKGIDSLVLACTHYPMIKTGISKFFEDSIKILDSGEVVAAKLKMILEKEGLACEKKMGDDLFYVSDFTESFQKIAKMFFGTGIQLTSQ
ncbi:MAG: glutamate racemase [Flavobacteriales bacterium]|nr:glutamate racemase [Flavobacteriales bacterium]